MALSRRTFDAWVQPISRTDLQPDEANWSNVICEDPSGRVYRLISFISDSCLDLPKALRERLGIVRAQVSALIEGNQGPNTGSAFEVNELLREEETEN